MKESVNRNGSWRKWFLITMAGLLFLFLILVTGTYVLGVSNQKKVEQVVKKMVKEKTGAEVTFSRYYFSLFPDFPFLSLVLEDIAVRDPGYATHKQELLRIDELALQFRFWNLLHKEFKVRSLIIDGGQATIFKNTDGSYSNMDFLRKDSTKTKPPTAGSKPLFSLDHARIKGFTFLLLDSLRTKSYHFEMRDTRLDMLDKGPIGLIGLKGDWYFHGLTFKFRNGAYLRDKEAEIDWKLVWNRDSSRLDISPSTLKVEGETYHLSGFLAMGKPPFLKLEIDHPGIMLEAGRRIIADNIRKVLENASIDRPVQVRVVVEGPLISGKPAPTDLYFSLADAGVSVGETILTRTSFNGHFYNCDPDGPVNPHSGCMDIDTFSTRIFGAIPVHGSAFITDLADPVVRLDAAGSMPLTSLESVLPPDKVEIREGRLDLAVQFEGQLSGSSGPVSGLSGGLKLWDGALRYLPTGLRVDDLNADLGFEQGDLVIRDFQLDLDDAPVHLRGELRDLAPFILSSDRQLKARLELRTGMLDIDRLLPPGERGKPARAEAGRKKNRGFNSMTSTIQALLKRFNADLDIYADGLRVRGYSASGVMIKSRMLSNCPEAGSAACLFLDTLNAKIYGDIPISASMHLTDLDDPRMRLDLQMEGPLTSFNKLLPPGQIRLNEGDISLELKYEGLLDDYFNMHDGRGAADFGGKVVVHGAAADYQAGKYLLRKVSADIQFDEDQLSLPALTMELNGNTIELAGQVNDFIPFLFSEEGILKAGLQVRSPELNFNTFPLKKKKEEQPRQPKAGLKKADTSLIARKLAAVTEHLEADLRIDTDKFIYRDFNAEEVRMHGSYRLSCSPGQPPSGCVQIDTFSARLFGNAPLRASFAVEDLDDPLLKASARVSMPLRDLNAMFPPEQLQFKGGTIDLQVNYRGQPHDHFDAINALVKADLSGEAVFTGADFDYVSKGYRFGDVNGRIHFDHHDLVVPRLELSLNDNPLVAKGRFNGLIPFLFSPQRALDATLEVEATEFSFDRFSAPAKHQKEDGGGGHEATPVTNSVNAALDSLLVNFKLSVDRLVYRNFTGHDLFADVHLDNDKLAIREAGMEAANGHFRLGGTVSGLSTNKPLIDLKASFHQADLSELFQSFDDFGQEGISYKNLEGILDAELSFKAQANENYDIDSNTMEGYFTLNIQDGVLQDFPMFTKMDNYFLRYRELDRIRFGSLKQIFRLEDQIMYIDQFELASSVLSFKLNGKYDLQKKGRTDLLFEIPMANLFEGDVSQEALDKYFDRGHGPALLMRIVPKADSTLQVLPVIVRKKQERKGK